MKKREIIIILVLIGLIFVGAYFFFNKTDKGKEIGDSDINIFNKDSEVKPEIISMELANYIAINYAPKYFSDTHYAVLNSIILYDLEGYPAAYEVTLRNLNSNIKTLEILNEKLVSFKYETNRLNEELKNPGLTPGERNELEGRLDVVTKNSYYPLDIVYFVVGGTKESKFIYNYSKGLPDSFMKKDKIDLVVKEKYSDYVLGRIIFLNETNYAYEASSIKDSGKIPLANNAILVNLNTFEIKSVGDQKNILNDLEPKESLSNEGRIILIQKWNDYELLMNKNKTF